MLRREDRLYFIHIPKTAGTTVISLLDAQFHADEICPAQLWKDLVTLPQEDLPRYRLFRGHFGAHGLDPFLPAPPVRMTMLRDPVALALSTYRFVRREPETPHHALVRSHNMSFADFVGNPQTRPEVSDKMVRNLVRGIRWQAGQGPILLDASRANRWLDVHKELPAEKHRLQYALTILRECAFFGLVERFEESMALMSWTFGWRPAGPVRTLNAAPERMSPADLPPRLLDDLLACNRNDTALYEEGRVLFDARMRAMLRDLARHLRPGEPMPADCRENPTLLRELLDRHHRSCLARRPESVQDGIALTLREPAQGTGGDERGPMLARNPLARSFVPSTEPFIDLPYRSKKALELTFRIVNAAAPDIVDGLRVTANGHPVDLIVVRGGRRGSRVFRGVIPANVVNESADLIRLAFRVNRTPSVSSEQHAVSDQPVVGFSLNWLKVRPVPATARRTLSPGEGNQQLHGRS